MDFLVVAYVAQFCTSSVDYQNSQSHHCIQCHQTLRVNEYQCRHNQRCPLVLTDEVWLAFAASEAALAEAVFEVFDWEIFVVAVEI